MKSDFVHMCVCGAQEFTVLISAPDNSYSHLYLRSLPLKDSDVPV